MATTPETLNHVLDDGGDSGAVHGVVDAVGRSHGLDLGDEVGVIAEESVGGTELGRQMQSRLLQVDGDDGPGSSHPGGHDGAHADRACPKDGNRLPGLHVERVEDGSRARLQAAAERCEQRQISVVGDLYETRCGHDGVSREGALPEEAAVEGLAALFLVLMHDARPIGPFAAEVERHERVAVGRVSVFALGAALAVGEGEQDLVARGYVLDLGADFFDYAAAFVSQHRGRIRGKSSFCAGQIGVAEAACVDLNECLCRAQWVQPDRLEAEWAVDLVEHQCHRGRHDGRIRRWGKSLSNVVDVVERGRGIKEEWWMADGAVYEQDGTGREEKGNLHLAPPTEGNCPCSYIVGTYLVHLLTCDARQYYSTAIPLPAKL